MRTERDGEIVDNSEQKEPILILHQPTTPGYHQYGCGCGPMTKSKALPESSMGCSGATPGWWFHYFEPVWTPFIQRLCRQKKVTLFEFERAASQVSGLTHIEKTIAISAFRQQQEEGLATSRNTTALRDEHSLSVV